MIYDGVKILVLDDDISFLEQIPEILGGYGKVDCYQTIDQGLAAIESTYYDIAILDRNFDNDSRNRTGLDVFKQIVALDRGVDVIMISGESDPRRIFELVNSGIHRFIPKPANVSEIRETVASILEDREERKRRLALSQDMGRGHSTPALIGNSPQMRQTREQIERLVANGAKCILLQGETGTGKGVVAKYIAQLADPLKPLVAVNCGALNDNLIQSALFGHVKGGFTGAERNKMGVFEAAAGGYVFLDEIGDMPLSQQPNLLCTLQEGTITRVGEVKPIPVNFRVISATHKDLKSAVANGLFREDLLYRISKAILTLPPLRERSSDITELVRHFLSIQSKRCSITDDAMNLLVSFDWPGNVRQLESVVENMVIYCDNGMIRSAQVIHALPELGKLPPSKLKRAMVGTYGMQLIARERHRFERAIIDANGDRTVAAKNLGLPRTTFFRKAKELGLVRSRTERSLIGLKQH